MSILTEIINHKVLETKNRKELTPIKLLEKSIYFETPVVSMKAYLERKDKVGIIAEIKRASPSAGTFQQSIDIEELSIGYMKAGASALSVLSDTKYFQGKNEDVIAARNFNYCPILRKDFIIDEYQLIEAKSIGADCILLIANSLSPLRCKELARFAKGLGLEVLLEVHDEIQIDSHANPFIDLIGVNNRDLHSFSTHVEKSFELVSKIPQEFIKVSESGLDDAKTIVDLKKEGFSGFLIGGYFMKHAHPEEACAKLIKEINSLKL